MNYEAVFAKGSEAKIRYLDADYQIIKQGDYVLCAQTGQPIDVANLRYWSVERQEAYSSAAASMSRYEDLK